MALGQSYFIGKAYGWGMSKIAKIAGADDEDVESVRKYCQYSMTGVLAVVTLDPIGASTAAAEEACNCAVDEISNS